jgi:hypothetical protein
MSISPKKIEIIEDTRRKQIQLTMLSALDTRAKLKKHQENKIRDYYSKVFKNENNSLAKSGISIRSGISKLSKTQKKQAVKIPAKKITMKSPANKIIPDQVSVVNPELTQN